MSNVKNTDDVLRALLDTELVPEKDVYLRRFGVNFRIRAIDGNLLDQITEECTYPKKGGGSTFDNKKFSMSVITYGCVNPNWSSPEILAKFGPTPIDAVQKRLLAGELKLLSDEILGLSGFGEDENAEIDEVKN
jgi:hypothetical protein